MAGAACGWLLGHCAGLCLQAVQWPKYGPVAQFQWRKCALEESCRHIDVLYKSMSLSSFTFTVHVWWLWVKHWSDIASTYWSHFKSCLPDGQRNSHVQTAEASISTRILGQDPTTFEVYRVHPISGPDQVLVMCWRCPYTAIETPAYWMQMPCFI